MTPRLLQVPLFVSPELEATVRALPAHLRDVARELRLHLVEDGRTFLEVTAAAVALEGGGVTLWDLLGGDRHRAPTAARHRAWHDCYAGMVAQSYPTVARAFGGRHHTTILLGVRTHAHRLAGERALAEAVAAFQQAAPANVTTARTG